MTKFSDEMAFKFALCAVESRVWTGAVTDSATSNEVTSSKQASSDAGKFVKVLVKSSALANVRNAVNKARAGLYASSVPWLASAHLVSIDRMGAINEMIEQQKQAFDAGVKKFIEEYPTLVEGAAKRLGALFDAEDYPSADELRNKFSFSVTWLPFTQAPADILSALDSEAAKLIESSVSEAVTRGKREARAEIIARTIRAVDGVAASLARYSSAANAGERAVLHESRIESLNQAASALIDYYFPTDQRETDQIEEVSTALYDVAREGVDTFKENPAARAKAEADLKSIKAKLEKMAS